jgi:hypothetical protein
MKHKVNLDVVKSVAPYRKEGYLEEVLRRGTLVDGVVELEEEDFNEIKEKYSTGRIAKRIKDINQMGELQFPTNKEKPEIKPPSIADMAKSLVASTAKWAGRGFKFATEEQVTSRLNECHGCEFWNSTALRGTGRCTKCGCSTWAKLRMATEKCPIGKW